MRLLSKLCGLVPNKSTTSSSPTQSTASKQKTSIGHVLSLKLQDRYFNLKSLVRNYDDKITKTEYKLAVEEQIYNNTGNKFASANVAKLEEKLNSYNTKFSKLTETVGRLSLEKSRIQNARQEENTLKEQQAKTAKKQKKEKKYTAELNKIERKFGKPSNTSIISSQHELLMKQQSKIKEQELMIAAIEKQVRKLEQPVILPNEENSRGYRLGRMMREGIPTKSIREEDLDTEGDNSNPTATPLNEERAGVRSSRAESNIIEDFTAQLEQTFGENAPPPTPPKDNFSVEEVARNAMAATQGLSRKQIEAADEEVAQAIARRIEERRSNET